MSRGPAGRRRGLARRRSARAVIVVLGAAGLVLASCGAVGPTAAPRRSIASTPAAHPAPRAVGAQAVGRPAHGVLERVEIPSGDGFRPRPAYVYVPAAAVRDPRGRLPVLELLHGTPGQPPDWIRGGHAVGILNAFAAAHHGEAPLVVMPDINGSHRADSECIRTASGADVESYLTRDVVSWVRARFAAVVGRERWWIAGLSEGGLCSAMLALRHPSVYSAFGDFSGEDVPSVEGLSAVASLRQLYGGDRTDEREHEPLWLLEHRRYDGMPAWFESGAADRGAVADQARMAAAARAAGLTVHVAVRPGGHAWSVWSPALRGLLDWLWPRS